MAHSTDDEFAAIDLGSNSFHMVIAREDAGQLRLFDRLREPVALGAGLDTKKRLTKNVQARALACLANFSQRLRTLPASHVRAVGTKTLRRATNARDFLREAERVLGRRIDVIPGREEARLIYHGVRAGGEMSGDAPHLVLDIGGASTEIAIGTQAQPDFTESISAGCVVATQKHFADGRVTESRWRRAVDDARIELRPLKRSVQKSRWQTAIGCSGSIKAIAGQIERLGVGDGEIITLDALLALRDELFTVGNLNAPDFNSLTDARRQVFAGGCVVLTAVYQSLGIEALRVSQSALREGVLYELFGRTEDDVQRHTVESVQRRFGVDRDQAERATDTLSKVLNSLKGDWAFTPDQSRLMGHAAHLHEVGLAVSHSQFHKHGELLLNRTDMPGFTRQEQTTLATLVRLQRRRYHAKLIPDALHEHGDEVMRMALILRIALILCRDRQSIPVDRIKLATKGTTATLKAPTNWETKHPLTHSELTRETELALDAGMGFTLKPM